MLVLTFQVGSHRLALDIQRVREVVPRVTLQKVVGSPAWMAGLLVYRGRAVPVLDLHRLLDAGECPPHLSSRIILVPLGRGPVDPGGEGESLVGLLAAQVADIREAPPGGQSAPVLHGANPTGLGTTLVDQGGILHLVDVERLLPGPMKDLLGGPP
jgi:chemotaxis-related protein WspB